MIINFTEPIFSNFLVQIIAWLVQICSSVALGIVIFTLLLKIITLPFDYFSRASMRKNSVKMEQMRPELEKLQKQYADNKELYNQKMMALYKKNGYSMFGSCLPTILTLVIFIIAINAFTNYSQFQNKKYFYNMSNSYNSVVYAGFEVDDNYIKINEKNIIEFNDTALYEKAEEGKIQTKTADGKEFNIFVTKTITDNSGHLEVYTENGYIKAKIPFKVKDGNAEFTENGKKLNVGYELIEGKIATLSGSDGAILSDKNNNLKVKVGDKEFTFAEINQTEKKMTELEFITDIQQEKSAETFRAENASFLWVKNIWVTDSPLKHPVDSDWELFKTTHEYLKQQPDANDIGAEGYASLIAKLDKEKTEPNGFFILVVLTAGISLLSQIVMSKTQKAQMELQTVDGQGAQTQKMMTWMMPIMMAIFAFMYTAAFSIYIILSSLMSLGLTYFINFMVDRQIKKQAKAGGDKKLRGRVYTPKEETKKPEKKEEKKPSKDDKFAHESGGDFLTGPKKNKGIKFKK